MVATLEKMSGVSHLSHPVCELVDEVVRLGARFRTLFASATEESGVSMLAYAVFIYIGEAGAPTTVPQIGRSIGRVRQVVQRAVNELIDKGWVEAFENPNHKRAPLLRLSASGERFQRESNERAIGIGDDLIAFTDAESYRRALADLRLIRSQIERYLRVQAERAEPR